MLGIGGPDECGHSFFVGELTDALEDQELLVSIIDHRASAKTDENYPISPDQNSQSGCLNQKLKVELNLDENFALLLK